MRDKEYSAYMLLNAPGFGAKSIHYVYSNLKQFGLGISDLFDKTPSQIASILPDIGRGKFSRADSSSLLSLDTEDLYSAYEKLKKDNIHIIGLDDKRYPPILMERLGENAPPILFCKGNLSLLTTDSISIVGSRDINDYAVKLTKRIANRLAAAEYNVTSGFAKGVDTSAHIGSLENNGTTTMILSYGFNHLSIKKDIKQYNWENNTLFISQFMPYEKFSGQNAMTRNKLVCALSKAVIVISSGPERDSNGKMSGTFDAGLTSLKYKIPLFVLNPSLLDPAPQGNSDLIKQGGIPLSNGNELIEHLNSLTDRTNVTYRQFDDVKEVEQQPALLAESETVYQLNSDAPKDKILNALDGKPLSINDIIERTQLNWSPKEMSDFLKKIEEIEPVKIKGSRLNHYKKKTQPSLF